MTEQEIRAFIEELDGKEVVWHGEKGIKLRAKFIADYDIGISLKPLDDPATIRQIFLSAGVTEQKILELEPPLDSPEFCLSEVTPNGIEKWTKGEGYFFLKLLLNASKTGHVKISPNLLLIGQGPSCPFA